MAKIDKESVKKLTKLSRIGCSDAEEAKLLVDLQSILSYVEQLEAVDTENVAACNHVLAEVCNVMRDDLVGAVLPREQFLANAQDKVGGYVRVPPILKST